MTTAGKRERNDQLGRIIFSPFHPLALAAYMPLFLFSQNPNWFHFSVVILPLALLLTLTVFIVLLVYPLFRDLRKTALFVSLHLLFFFSYGHARNLIGDFTLTVGQMSAGYNILFFFVWLIALLGSAIMLKKTRIKAYAPTAIANVAAVALLVCTLVHIAFASGTQNNRLAFAADDTDRLVDLYRGGPAGKNLPDIMYIILDAYPRSDVMRAAFRHDNTVLVDFLAANRFCVSNRSYAHYGSTDLSLASSFSMNYVHTLYPPPWSAVRDVKSLIELKVNGTVIRFLKKIGYSFVLVTNGLETIEPSYADHCVGPHWTAHGLFFDEFQNGLIRMTPLPIVAGYVHTTLSLDEQHRQRVSFAFDYLSRYRKTATPRFIFAHIIAPHDPLVFGANGEPIDNDKTYWELLEKDTETLVRLFGNEAAFLEKQVARTVASIIKNNPAHPPVIIIQSDHGSSLIPPVDAHPSRRFLQERHGIFMAIHAPGGDVLDTCETLAPVNLFRRIFNCYFKLDMHLIENKIYTPYKLSPSGFSDVSDSLFPHDRTPVERATK